MDTSALLTSFSVALLVRTPLLLVAIVGVVLSWVRVRPASRPSHRICVVGLSLLGAHVLADAYGRAYNVALALGGATREELATAAGMWTLGAYALLVAASACLVAAVVAGRSRAV